MSGDRVVLGGASGFMGRALRAHYAAAGREVVTIGRTGADLAWADAAGIADAVDGASLVVGLAGKSVNCRYTERNRDEIFASRLTTTRALSRAIAAADAPPPLWVNSSTATIYRHADDRPMTESDGEIGTGFSVEVAKAWERELFAADLPATRRVALRSAIVLGRDGGVLPELAGLARVGLGGPQLDGWWPVTPARVRAGTAHRPGTRGGRQRFSWVHIADVLGILDHLERTTELTGPVNASAPGPVESRDLMAAVRQRVGARVSFPMPRWMLEIGALARGTETELILKSRWVLPERLVASGYTFAFPTLGAALDDLLT
ncbi:NAD-dependent epimerase [Microbacterium aurum]|uniref:NAD-dependent epimerase n=1 Tax=Microbacterium aurum TaxID=36805 RepID=A0A1P8U4R7_9MICO|nr:DUF1731 domain-containing protein [Microbacterium aurum]APZ33109.1 NAD-dependent epimerase [Microbacterium aurum]MBM7826677.1 NAD dependent epimerase/dehydratase family enzyme [Microbacterium aurum]